MALLDETIVVSAPIEEAFDYAAEFQNTQQWDPGVIAASKRGDDPAAVGTAFDLVTVFKGNESDMVYTITELDRPNRVVLSGEGKMVSAVDTMTFRETDGGTEIHYIADLGFKGLAKIGTLFLGGALDKLGGDAVAGLKAALD